jgi:hypothetical protein
VVEVWVTHERGALIQWEFEEGENINTWSIHKRNQEPFVEHADRAEWGTLYFSGPAVRCLLLQLEASVSSIHSERFVRRLCFGRHEKDLR